MYVIEFYQIQVGFAQSAALRKGASNKKPQMVMSNIHRSEGYVVPGSVDELGFSGKILRRLRQVLATVAGLSRSCAAALHCAGTGLSRSCAAALHPIPNAPKEQTTHQGFQH